MRARHLTSFYLLGIAATARILKKRIWSAELVIYATGGHIWLEHDTDVAERIAEFIQRTKG